MLLIPCPYCGEERPEIEFRNGGEAHVARPLCGRFFNAVRHTVSDRILMTYKAGEPRPDPSTIPGPTRAVPQGAEDVGAKAAGEGTR